MPDDTDVRNDKGFNRKKTERPVVKEQNGEGTPTAPGLFGGEIGKTIGETELLRGSAGVELGLL